MRNEHTVKPLTQERQIIVNSQIKIRTGKTKEIWTASPSLVEVVLSDNVTAGNGTSVIQVEGKGEASNAITCNCFRLLRSKNIPTSFISPVGKNSFNALFTKMAPIEVVCRGFAAGSYLKRNKEFGEGYSFPSLAVEFFYKDDEKHDPIIVPGPRQMLHRADQPVTQESEIGLLPWSDWTLWGEPMTDEQRIILFQRAHDLVTQAYSALYQAWYKKGFTLVDIKIEVGVCPTTGEVLISDAITPDEWRLWKNGDKEQSYDKDPFRKSAEKGGEEIKRLILDRYREIAKLTADF